MNKTTKSAQFTPGPWVIEKGWNGDRPTITAKVSKTQVIDNRGLIADLEHTPFIEHAQANATLIAAAPAMYAELVNGLGLLEASYHDMCDKYGKDSMQAEVVWDQVERTRNVIAQAEGRQA